jgi:hypothetical protein
LVSVKSVRLQAICLEIVKQLHATNLFFSAIHVQR